ncbi:MAG: MotA/TolQ/ExbB proton channel family protein [Fuerstiella sp.]
MAAASARLAPCFCGGNHVSHQRPRSGSALRTGLVAGCLLGGFYLAGQLLPGTFFRRYFLAHPLEQVSTGMFFVGLAILLQKLGRLRLERRSLEQASDSLSALADGHQADEQMLRDWLQQQTAFAEDEPAIRDTLLQRRLQDASNYLQNRGHNGLEEHLRYLAELAGDRLHQSYATIRTVTWAIPILGFLGTVIGITMAIANVTPEQLDSSISEVTQGLSVAFDTTALALGLSIVLVFASFAVERSEQKVLSDVEQFGIDQLLPHLGDGDQSGSGLPTANQALTADWQQQLTELREMWTAVLGQNAQQLQEAVSAQVNETLQLHRTTTSDARDAYATALQQSSSLVVERAEAALAGFEVRMQAWQKALQTTSQDAVAQTEALHELGRTLLRMTEAEDRLIGLQSSLNENLQALQVAETLQQTAHSLTAAVHVMTARSGNRNAA